MNKSRDTATCRALRLIDTVGTSHSHTPSSPTPGEAHDTRHAHTMVQMASGEEKTKTRGSFGTVAVVIFPLLLLALLPSSVQASASSQSSCVQITDAALYSSCASGRKVASFAFTMEGRATGTTAHTVKFARGGEGRCLRE